MNILIAMCDNAVTRSFLSDENLETLSQLGTVYWDHTVDTITPQWLRDHLPGMDVCVCGWGIPRFDANVLEKADQLKLVAYVAGSVFNVVSDEMYERGVRIVCGNEMFAQSVAEGTMAFMLASLRRIVSLDRQVHNGGWRNEMFSSEGLLEKTVGLVGYGAITRHLIPMLKPFHVKIKLFSKHMTEEEAQAIGVQKASLEEIFSTCKVVSLHCARSTENYHLVDRKLLQLLMPGALLVNTARGDIIDEAALADALATGRFHAVLDVYEQEPLPMDSPLRKLDNVILMPHTGGPTVDRRPACARVVIGDIARLQQGLPLENEIVSWRAKMMTK